MTALLSMATNRNKYPCEGAKIVPLSFDFSATGFYNADITPLIGSGGVMDLQGVFIDNADNSYPVVLTVAQTNHRVVCPENSQGFFVLFMGGGSGSSGDGKFSIYSAGAVVVNIMLLNMPIPPEVWSTL